MRSTRVPSDLGPGADRASSPASRARRVRRLARNQGAGEGGGVRAVLGDERFEPLERTLAPGEADAIDGEIVDQTRVEMMLGVTGTRLRHAGSGLLGDPELGAEGTDELGEHGLVAQVARDLWETGEELVDGHRARRRARPSFQIARVTDLHAVDLQTRLYPRELTGPPRSERGP